MITMRDILDMSDNDQTSMFNYWEPEEDPRLKSPLDMVKEFRTKMSQPMGIDFDSSESERLLANALIREEFFEVITATTKEDLLKELADLVYVCYQGAASFGWDLDEAVRRVHESNLSKLDDNGKPIKREDGKVIKGPNYKKPNLKDLV